VAAAIGGIARAVAPWEARSAPSNLREWAPRELRGCDADVPEYRCIPAGIFADYVTGSVVWTSQHIGTSLLPGFAEPCDG
jgi:hypothetical protein